MIRFNHVIGAAVLALATAPISASAQSFDRSRPPILGASPALTVPEVSSGALANGASVKVVEHRKLPLVQVTLQIAGGARLDRETPGIASFNALMIREGAGTRDANALQSELAFLGASLSSGANWDNTTISLKVPRRNLEAALDLMADVVLRPWFGENDTRRQKELRLAGILQQKDQPRAIAGLAFNQLLFPEGHPYHHAVSGDSVSTSSLDSALVRGFYDGAFRPNRATFTVVGDLSQSEAVSMIESRFGSWSGRGAERTPWPVRVQPARPEGRNVYLVDKPGAAQSVIYIGTTGVERTTGDYAAIEVMNTILGGSFSSRLMTNLRETMGYTYGVRSGFQWMPLPGAFVMSSDVRTNVTDSSMVEFMKEIASIRDAEVDDVELERAKAYIKLGLPGDLETTSQIASQITALSLFNLPLGWLEEFAEAIDRVTVADVQRVARRYVPEENALIVIVGDLSQIRSGIEALNLGTITVLDVNTIAR